MAINVHWLDYLDKKNIFSKDKKILDIGLSNVQAASADYIKDFIKKYNNIYSDDYLNEFSNSVEYNGRATGSGGCYSDAFFGDLAAHAGMKYTSFDIIDHPLCFPFDLNRSSLPENWKNYFDITLNFGTTEHILNQYHAMKIIHEATKPGGYIFHQVPSIGYINHGYFNYNPMFFFDIAESNKCDIVEIAFTGEFSTIHLASKIKDSLTSAPSSLKRTDFLECQIPDSGLNVLMKKNTNDAFRYPYETTTTVGSISSDVLASGDQ